MIFPRDNTVDARGKPRVALYMDTLADLPNLPPLERVAAGSDAYCLATQDVYILSAETGQWEAQ